MSNIPSKLHRACDCYGKGKLISQYRFYALVKAGRIRLYHLGPGGAYSAETDVEIILRIDREDAEQADQPESLAINASVGALADGPAT